MLFLLEVFFFRLDTVAFKNRRTKPTTRSKKSLEAAAAAAQRLPNNNNNNSNKRINTSGDKLKIRQKRKYSNTIYKCASV